MGILNNNCSVNREAEDKMSEHLRNIASSIVSGASNAVAHVKNMKKDIDKETQEYFEVQARQQAYYQFMMAQRYLKNLLALGLNNMPPHLRFLGTVSPHSIKVSMRDNGIIRAEIPCDMTDAPKNFHIFRDVLQEVMDSLHREAVDTLRDRIMVDAHHIQDLILTGQWNLEEEARIMKEYNDLYQSVMERLFGIRVVSVQRQHGGISIDIEATFNDVGMSPNNYPANIRSVV